MDIVESGNLAPAVRAALIPSQPSEETFAARMAWRLNRLRCMGPAEILHRVGRVALVQAEGVSRQGPLAKFFDSPVPEPEMTAAPSPWLQAVDVPAAPYVAAADRLCLGHFDVFALKGLDLGTTPRWNRDPRTGTEAPVVFGKTLDYRDPRRVGDIKYLWELNRHSHLVTLAQAYALTGHRKYFDTIEEHLQSWFVDCPYGVGPNWSSALEASLRLINWSMTWQLLGGAQSPLFADGRGAELQGKWMESVYRHCQFVRGFFSRHSSANNHLIGEAAGLYVAAVTWPLWPASARWRGTAQAFLERECLAQNASDGVNREQAVCYQQFELDLLLLPFLAAKAQSGGPRDTTPPPFSAAYVKRMEVMMAYVASIMDAGGHVPMIGDADDGRAAYLVPTAGFCPYRSLLATGAVLFRRGDFKAKAAILDDKTLWLLGPQARNLFEALKAKPEGLPPRREFPEGGYYILGSDFETQDEIRLIADAGPLGYQSIAAHGHADALSFTLSVGGFEFLVDPGTYAYHTNPGWRRYFRGTSAHNTVRVDGLDQSRQGGNFLWLDQARSGCRIWHSTLREDLFEGWHDGYRRLNDPVIHRRRIRLDKRARRIIIEDQLEMRSVHDVELFFHCAEDCQVDAEDRSYTISRRGRSIQLRPAVGAGLGIQIYRGSVAPVAGWISRRFDQKRPTHTIVCRGRLSGRSVLRSEIQC